MGPEQFEFVNQFVSSVCSNQYEPLYKWTNQKRETHIFFEDNVVKLGESSLGRVGALGHNILRRARKIKFDDDDT